MYFKKLIGSQKKRGAKFSSLLGTENGFTLSLLFRFLNSIFVCTPDAVNNRTSSSNRTCGSSYPIIVNGFPQVRLIRRKTTFPSTLVHPARVHDLRQSACCGPVRCVQDGHVAESDIDRKSLFGTSECSDNGSGNLEGIHPLLAMLIARRIGGDDHVHDLLTPYRAEGGEHRR